MKPSATIFLALALALPVFAQGAPEAAGKKPNIVFILVDDQRNDTLGCAGHPVIQTPNIDQFAKDGIRFENMFVNTSICMASRATIFTGLTETTHGYTGGPPPAIPLQQMDVDTSFPVLLKQAGYRTGYFGKQHVKFAEGTNEALKRMFDQHQVYNGGPHHIKQADGSMRHTAELIGDRSVEFLDSQPADQPFMLYMSFNIAHARDGDHRPGIGHFPWPKAVDGMYDDMDPAPPRLGDPKYFEMQPEFLQKSLNRVRWFWRWDTPEKYKLNMRAYYRMLTGMDGVIGRVRETIRTKGLDDNTVYIYTADNGYYMGDRGFAGKWSHYEQSLRVPLIIDHPKFRTEKKDKVEAKMASNLDLPSTMLEVAGIELPQKYQGHSLMPLLRGEEPENWRTDLFNEHHMNHESIPKWRGVRGQRFTYARYYEQEPAYEFLHDLQTDPDQTKNLASDPEFASVLNEMRARTDEYVKDYTRPEIVALKEKSTPPKGGALPNIVMIISDDQGWTDYSFMGHEQIQTPRLDQLAKESALFRRGYVPSSLCRPSLATLATGLYAHQHRISGNDPVGKRGPQGNELREKLISHIDRAATLPRMLGRRGYLSLQTGKWWEGNYARGGFTHGMTRGFPEPGGRHGDDGLKIGREGMEPITDFIAEAQKKRKPFFIWYAPFLPHTPHNPPQRLLDKYSGDGISPKAAKYYAMCEWFDETCGQLLDHLDSQGLSENTLVVYVTDNGWQEGSEGAKMKGGKRSPYDGGLRTPIMLRWPGNVKPGDYEATVNSIDLVPTILAASGMKAQPNMQGVNLLPVANGQPLKRDTIFGETFAHDVANVDVPAESLQTRWAIEDGRWKLILNSGSGAAELYDLHEDPHEATNLAAENGETVKRLTGKINAWWNPDKASNGKPQQGSKEPKKPAVKKPEKATVPVK